MPVEVTVIIPVYNGEHKIKTSLSSLLKQTYKGFEVVIIDDGSTDRTRTVVDEYANSLDITYFHQENAGVSVARNKGIELAVGEFLCFLDCDDSYEPEYIKKMLSTIKLTNSDICYCGYNVITPTRFYRQRTQFTNIDVLKKYILAKVAVHTTGWMLRKEFLEQQAIRFRDGVSWGEDFEFFCRALSSTQQVTYVKEYLTNYRYGFSSSQLSAFSIDKLDMDFQTINSLVSNPKVNTGADIQRALLDFRLPGLLTYQLIEAIQQGISYDVVGDYYHKYESYLTRCSWNNGLRSVKLNLNKMRLNRLVKRR